MIISFLAGFGVFSYYFATSPGHELEFVGKNALILMGAKEEAYNSLVYLQKASSYSLNQSLFDVAKDGGHYLSECGELQGVQVWADIKKIGDVSKGVDAEVRECYPEIKNSLGMFMQDEIEYYVSRFPELPKNYNFEVVTGSAVKIKQTSDEKITAPVKDEFMDTNIESEKILGEYKLDSSLVVVADKLFLDKLNEFVGNSKTDIVETCKFNPNVDQCLLDEASNYGLECTDTVPEILYNFLDVYMGCLSREEDEVFCAFELPGISNSINGDFRVEFEKTNKKVAVSLFEGRRTDPDVIEFINLPGIYSTDFDDKQGIEIDKVVVDLEYVAGVPTVKFIQSRGNNPMSAQFLYKNNNRVMFVGLGSPESKFRTQTRNGAIGSAGLPSRKVSRFCKEIDQTVRAFDGVDLKDRKMEYYFGISYPVFRRPPPVDRITAEDKLKAERQIVVGWSWPWPTENLIEEANFDHFNVYCSENVVPIDVVNPGNLKLTDLEPVYEIRYTKEVGIKDPWSIDIDKCVNSLGQVDEIKEGVEYNIAVTTVYNDGAESFAKTQIKGKSEDDLAPGLPSVELDVENYGLPTTQKFGNVVCDYLPITADLEDEMGGTKIKITKLNSPDKNADCSAVEEPETSVEYDIHYEVYTPGPGEITFDPNYKTDNLNVCVNCRPSRFIQPEFFDSGLGFLEGSYYCFTVVSRDPEGNIITKIKEDGSYDCNEFETYFSDVEKRQWNKLENYCKAHPGDEECK